MTGGRLKRLKNIYLMKHFYWLMVMGFQILILTIRLNFIMTINITISAVRPPARFGSLSLDGSTVTNFKEKQQLEVG